MQTIPYQHDPVMALEVLDWLRPQPGQTFVDCTLGGGGHAVKLKAQTANCKIIGLDQDQEAITAAQEKLGNFSGLTFIQDNFANLEKHLKEKVDGFLFDLGVSSYQLDNPERGFSFRQTGPLDMRLSQRQTTTAREIVNHSSEQELARIFFEYGEERFARRLARAVVKARQQKPINTTEELKTILEPAIPTWRKRESVTRVFQALRIAVNAELASLKSGLQAAIAWLKPGGRIIVISYHSLEDRLVKQTFRQAASNGILKLLTKKPLVPSAEEIKFNRRAGSAKMRVAEKT